MASAALLFYLTDYEVKILSWAKLGRECKVGGYDGIGGK